MVAFDAIFLNFNEYDTWKIDPDLLKVYANVLPICNTCKSVGEKTLVGRYTIMERQFDNILMRASGQG